MEIHVVSPGENVDQIAARYNMPVETLLRNNQIVYPYRLAVGQALLVGEESKGSLPAESSGYAYPFISPWVLGETLPFLTKIFVFSYGFTEDGDLIEPWKDDTWLIEEATRRGVEPILTLTPMGEEGTFNNFPVHIKRKDSRHHFRVVVPYLECVFADQMIHLRGLRAAQEVQ